MPDQSVKPLYVVRDKDGRNVSPGDRIKDFRGDVWVFESVSRGVEYNGTAKVVVSDPNFDAAGQHWSGWREFYAQVFDLQVITLFPGLVLDD